MILKKWENIPLFVWIGNFLRQLGGPLKALRKNADMLKKLEKLQREQIEATEGLFYFTLLRELWPEAAQSFVPRVGLTSESIGDIHNHYIRKPQPRALQKQVSAMLAQMAEGLVELPLVDRVALFEEAVRPRSESTPLMYARYIVFLTLHGHDDELLLRVCSRFESLGTNVWDNNCARAWACYLALLLRKGEEGRAGELLALHVANHGLEEIAGYPRLALFARNQGFSTPEIAASALLMESGQQSSEKRVLERYLAGKSVAIVGSSPLELGRGRGEEIDAHDVVVRVNALPHPADYADFGQKSSIFARNLSKRVDFPKLEAVDLVLGTEGLERYSFSPRALSGFAAIARDKPGYLVFPSLEAIQKLLIRSPFTQFSSGVLAAAYFKDLAPGLTRASLFGFTHFLDDEIGQYGELSQYHHHYPRHQEPLGNALFQGHSLKREREFLQIVFPAIP